MGGEFEVTKGHAEGQAGYGGRNEGEKTSNTKVLVGRDSWSFRPEELII